MDTKQKRPTAFGYPFCWGIKGAARDILGAACDRSIPEELRSFVLFGSVCAPASPDQARRLRHPMRAANAILFLPSLLAWAGAPVDLPSIL
jgi:hypothetical protein